MQDALLKMLFWQSFELCMPILNVQLPNIVGVANLCYHSQHQEGSILFWIVFWYTPKQNGVSLMSPENGTAGWIAFDDFMTWNLFSLNAILQISFRW